MPKKNSKAQREHHYVRVVLTYTDGETSASRVFKDKIKAEKYAAKQKKSLTVKSATLKSVLSSEAHLRNLGLFLER